MQCRLIQLGRQAAHHAVLMLSVMLMGACASQQTGSSSTSNDVVQASTRIDVIQVMTPPTAFNLDDRPGPDGLPVTVYLFRMDEAKPVVLQSGELSFLLYEGRVGREALEGEPFHTWTFTAQQLQSTMDRTSFGWTYRMPLHWGTRVPRASHITLFARYRPVKGTPVYSAPNALSVAGK